MPDTDHNHPDYEQAFSRIATILDVLAQEQLTTDRTLREFIAHANERDAETTDKLNALIEHEVGTADKLNGVEQALREYIAKTTERDAETTDKLNALIDLMDRHLREHGNGSGSEPKT